MSEKRIHYLDNIRIVLTAIVVIHHVLVSYGAPGGWYYKEFDISQLDLPTLITLVFITAFTQAYFMGFFFFLSGIFSARSLHNKSAFRFLVQRLTRLGLPILLFVYLISPLLRLVSRNILYQQEISLENITRLYRSITFSYELGPMWFALLLLILSLVLFPFLRKDILDRIGKEPLTRPKIVFYAIVIGSLTFILRIFQPVGSVFQPLNLQLPHTLQYILLFLAGSLFYHRNWLDRISEIYSRNWILLIAGLMIIMPVIFIFSGGLEGDAAVALGGLNWQSFVYSIWEQLLCVSIIVVFLYYFQVYANHTSPILKELASSSFATYLIHPLILVVITALLDFIKIHPLGKISISLVPGLVLSFLAAGLIRRLPGLRQII